MEFDRVYVFIRPLDAYVNGLLLKTYAYENYAVDYYDKRGAFKSTKIFTSKESAKAFQKKLKRDLRKSKS